MKHEIYWDDLNIEAQYRLKDLFHNNLEFIPLTIIETE